MCLLKVCFFPSFYRLFVFRLQSIREADIQDGGAGALQDPQRRHGEECVRGGRRRHPHLPQQGIACLLILGRITRWHSSPAGPGFRRDQGPFLSLQPVMLRDLRLGAGPNDGESQRRIGRSLSGTMVTSRRGRLTATRSFVSRTPALCCLHVASCSTCLGAPPPLTFHTPSSPPTHRLSHFLPAPKLRSLSPSLLCVSLR